MEENKTTCSLEEFQENLDLIKKNHPLFWLHLQKIPLDYLEKEVFLLKKKHTLSSTQGNFVLSSQSFLSERRRLEDCTCYYQLGTVDEWGICELCAWLKQDVSHRVIIFEISLEAFYLFLLSCGVYEFLKHRNITFVYVNERASSRHLDAARYSFNQTKEFFIHPCYAKAFPSWSLFFQRDMLSKSLLFSKLYAESLSFGKHYYRNFFGNLPFLLNSRDYVGLQNQFKGIPVIICGAGPSLEKQITQLQSLKDRALIIACGASMGVLSRFHLAPHFIVALDPTSDEITRVERNSHFHVPLIYRIRLNTESLGYFHSELLLNNYSVGYPVSRFLSQKFEVQQSYDLEGCSSVTFASQLALKMGCHPIIFLGVDLGHTSEKIYSSGGMDLVRYHQEIDRAQGVEWEGSINDIGLFGKMTTTRWKWICESHWLYSLILDHPHHTWINASLEGIGIKHIANIPLSVIAQQWNCPAKDLVNHVHLAIQNIKYLASDKEQIVKAAQEIMEGIHQAQNQVGFLLDHVDEILRKPSEFSKRALIQQEFFDGMIFEYFLKDCWEFVLEAHSLEKKVLKLPDEEHTQQHIEELFLLTSVEKALQRFESELQDSLERLSYFACC